MLSTGIYRNIIKSLDLNRRLYDNFCQRNKIMANQLKSIALEQPIAIRDTGIERVPLLLPRKGVLAGAIFERCLKGEDIQDPHRRARLSTKAFCILMSAGAKVPYVPISLRLPGGPFFAIGNVSSFFILEYWAIKASINDVLGPKGRWEVTLLQNAGRGRCYEVSTLTASIAIALLSQIPVALPALDYDGKYRIPGFVVLLVAGALFPVRSLQLSIDKALTRQRYCLGDVEKKLEQIREEVISLTQEYREIFRLAGYEEKMGMIAALAATRVDNESEEAEPYLSLVFGKLIENPPQKRSRLCERISKGVGYFLTASFETALAMYTWSKTKEHLINNDAVAGSFAAVTVLSWAYLTGESVATTTHRCALSLFDLLRCRKNQTLSEQIRPRLNLSLKLLGITLNAAALGPTVVIWGDFYKDNAAEQGYFEATICATLFLLLATATLDIIDETVKEIILKNGTPDQKQMLELNTKLLYLQQLLHRSSLLDFSTLLLNCPDRIKENLLQKVDLTVERVTELVEREPVRLA